MTTPGQDAQACPTCRADLTEDDAHAVIAALQAEIDRRDTAQTGGE